MTETRALVLATVLRVKDSHFIFPFCDVCYCKVTKTRRLSRFECSKCKRSFNESQLGYRYRLSATISDGSAVCDVSIFGKCLQFIFGTEPAVFNRLLTRHTNSKESEETEKEELLLKMMSDLIVGKQFYFGFKLPVKRNTVSSRPHSTLKYVLSHLRPQKNEKTAWKSAISDGIVAYQLLNPMLTPCRQNLFHVLKHHFGEDSKKMPPGNINTGPKIQFACQNEAPKLALLGDSSSALNSDGITKCAIETRRSAQMSQNKIIEKSEHTLNVLGESSAFETSTQFSLGMTSLELTCETSEADRSEQTVRMIRDGNNPTDVSSQHCMASHLLNSTCYPNKIPNYQHSHEPNNYSGSATTNAFLQEQSAAACVKSCDKATDVAVSSQASSIVNGNSLEKDRDLLFRPNPPVSKSIDVCNLSNSAENMVHRSFSLTCSQCKQTKDISTIDENCKRSGESDSNNPSCILRIPPPTSSTNSVDDDHKSQAYFTGIYNHLEMLTASPTEPSLVPSQKLPITSTSKCNDSSTRVSCISKINSDHDSFCSTLQHFPSDLHSSRPQMCSRVKSVSTGLKEPKLDHSINGDTCPPGSQHKSEFCSRPLSRERNSPIAEEESNNSVLAADMPLSEDFELFLQQIEAQYAASEKGTEDQNNSCVETLQDCSLKKPVACVKQDSRQDNQPVETVADIHTHHSSCNPGRETSHVKLLEKMPLDNCSNDSPVKDIQCDSALLDSSAFSYSGSQELFSQSYIECKPVKDEAFPKNHSTPFTVINQNMPEMFNRNKFKSLESTVFNKGVLSTPLLFSQDSSSAISPLENCSKDNKDRLCLSKSCSKRMLRKQHLKTKTTKLCKIQQASPYACIDRGQNIQHWKNSCIEKLDQERGSALHTQVADSTPDLFEEAVPDISDIVNSSKNGTSMLSCSQSWDVSHDLFSPSQNISEDLQHLKRLTTGNEKMTLRKKLF